MLLDDTGWAYRLVLEGLGPERVTGRIVERLQPDTEPRTRLWLHQALLTERKMDWVLQKGTELGVAVFAPIATERSVHGRKDGVDAAKLERWRRIVREAAAQSGRAPSLLYPQNPPGGLCARRQDGAWPSWPSSIPPPTPSVRPRVSMGSLSRRCGSLSGPRALAR